MAFLATEYKTGQVLLPDVRAATVAAIRVLERQLRFRLTQNQFQAFGAGGHQLHGGSAWVPLRASTVRIKAAMGSPTPGNPLMRTGKMSGLSRIRLQLRVAGNSIKYNITAYNLAPYSGYHMKPTWNHWSGTFNPVRKVVDITQADLEMVEQLIRMQIGAPKAVEVKRAGPVARAKGWVKRAFGRFFGR